MKSPKQGRSIEMIGKRNKCQKVSLNSTARSTLKVYLSSHPTESIYLFFSEKTDQVWLERGLHYPIEKCAEHAKLYNTRM